MRARGRFFALLLAGLAGTASARDPALTEAELAALRSRIATAQAQRQETAGAAAQAEAALAGLEAQVAEAAKALRATAAELSKTRDTIAELKTEKAGLEADREQQKAALAVQLRQAYATGRQDVVKLILNQEDPNELGRLLAYYGYLSRARSLDIGQLTATLDQLARVETTLFAEVQALDALKLRQETEQQGLATLQQERAGQLAALKASLGSQDRRLKKLEGDARALEGVLAALREELARMSRAASLQGLRGQERRLSWPVAGTLATRFGAPSPQGLRSTAVEFRAPEGQEVAAVHQGRVVFADWLRGYGLVLIIDHGAGWMSLYGHAQALLKTSGDWVEPGEPVATTGTSGGQEAAGLYFEIRHQGVPVDPALYCRR